jgi:soluble lytic murein transglycosylase
MFFSARVRRLSPSWLLLMAGGLLASAVAHAAQPNTTQREAFRQAYAAAQQGGNGWKALAAGLHGYPLYPYLQAAALEHDIQQIDRPTVEAYLRQYPDWIPAADLKRAFLIELARRQDWQAFLAMYQPGMGDTLSCDALQARVAGGVGLDFDRDLAALWNKPSLPSACDTVLSAAHDQGLLTNARLWTRIQRAVDAGKGGTVASLASWLSAPDSDTAQQLALALRDPSAATTAAANWPDTTRDRQAVTLAITGLARRQVDSADAAWQQLQSRFQFSQQQRDQILHAIALFRATDFTDDAIARLLALPAAAQSDATREWRVRVALARQDWTAVLAGIKAMSASQASDGEWQYFRARALAALGHPDEARQQYAAQAQQATFFGFLAADKLQQPYAICPLTLADDPQRQQQLLALPGIVRALELYAVDQPQPARREWNRALAGTDQATQRVAADLANQRGWYDRAVFTLSSGEALRIYDLRFPLASQDGLVPQAKQAGIEPAWAYGILRAESAWQSDAHSGADARGLMQLLPATATLVAQRNGLVWGGAETLYDPNVNIELGTRYLAEMAGRYNGSSWLASAAYNAGPNRVDQWLAERGTLAPDLFVATIPFKETREYVARVMAFALIYDWRLNGSVVPLDTRMGAIGQAYVLPTDATVRRAVSCPASDQTTPAATAANESP